MVIGIRIWVIKMVRVFGSFYLVVFIFLVS